MDHDEASASAAAIDKAAAKESSPKDGIIPDLVISEELGPPAVAVGVGSGGTGRDSPPTLIDLTLNDTDEEGDVAPLPASARFKNDGRLADFGMYAGSLREKRVPPSQERPGDNMVGGDAPKAVTPLKGTKNKRTETFGGGDEDSSDDDSALFSSSDSDSDNDSLLPSDADDDDADPHDDEDDNALVSPSYFADDDDADLFPSSDDDAYGNDADLHDEDDDDADLFPSGDDAGIQEGHADGDDDSSRFSEDGHGWIVAPRRRPPRRQVVNKKMKKERAKTLVTTYKAPPEERYEPEFYYFAHLWGREMRKVTSTLREGPPPPVLSKGKYQILVSDLVTRKGKGFHEDKMGNKYYKSHYLKLSDSGVRRSIESALLSIGDFETLTYEHGPHKTHSRLKLLVSPSCRPPDGSKDFCFHEIPPNHFEVIEDNGHLGCGFIHPAYLKQLLGNSTAAQRVFAIQVRIIGPSSVGVAKGMLFVKEDLEEYKIQLPTSMVKVNKSKTAPLHTHVVLNIRQCFPSSNQKCMGKLLDDSKSDPSLKQIKALKLPSPDVRQVMLCKGVAEDNLQEYMESLNPRSMSSIAEAKNKIKHGNVVGVCDPTGHISSGHVFLTGMGGMGELAPSEVFLTRYPCTEGKDGIVVKVASWRDMPKEAFQFLDGLDFGAVVFPLGDNPLPPTINDGDLDGDLYPCIWDQNLIAGMTTNVIDECLGDILSDDLVGHTLESVGENGKVMHGRVMQKIGDNLYQVTFRLKKNEYTKEMTREEIYSEGTEYISAVVGHRAGRKKSKSVVEFNLTWSNGETEWRSAENIHRIFATPPANLLQYLIDNRLLKNDVLPKQFIKWANANMEVEVLVAIIEHRINGDGSIDVLCRYSDDDEQWTPMAEARSDSKLFLGAYAKKKKLFNKPGWEGVSGFWLEEVRDLMCKEVRSHEISNLVPRLNRLWRKAIDENGGNHNDTIFWGRAYKTSLEIEKHGGCIKLPHHLHLKLPKDLQKFVEIV